MKITRRKLAIALASGAAIGPVQGQTAPQPSQTPDDLLKTARDRIKATGDALAKEQLPMSTEPAFQFKA